MGVIDLFTFQLFCMKRLLPISIAVLVLFSFSSCTKTVVVADGGVPVAGSWVLAETSQRTGYGWQLVRTGLESGVFDFYSNGDARYNDGATSMAGSWLLRYSTGGYYDRYGDYYSGSHQAFEIHMRDRYTGGSVDLFFDEVIVTGNSLIATYYNGNYVSRYVFNRY
jgi:hypothetical protein